MHRLKILQCTCLVGWGLHCGRRALCVAEMATVGERKVWLNEHDQGRTGDGRCSRAAASFSPGASKATTGAPNVTPIREERDPPRE